MDRQSLESWIGWFKDSEGARRETQSYDRHQVEVPTEIVHAKLMFSMQRSDDARALALRREEKGPPSRDEERAPMRSTTVLVMVHGMEAVTHAPEARA